MILGFPGHTHAQCFREINDAVEALTDRCVCFNAHEFPAPPGAIVYNLENLECWDFNAENAAKYGAKHVPIGYHPSMERLERAKVLDIDVVFSGAMNERRKAVLMALADRGLNVVHVPHEMYGAERDALLARAKLALNLQYYPDGAWPVLRVAHLVANHVPVLSEAHPEAWDFVPSVPYAELIQAAVEWVEHPIANTESHADWVYRKFCRMPMVLPS